MATKDKDRDWEKRFEKKYGKGYRYIGPVVDTKKLKQFIAQEKALSHKEGAREVLEEIKKLDNMMPAVIAKLKQLKD